MNAIPGLGGGSWALPAIQLAFGILLKGSLLVVIAWLCTVPLRRASAASRHSVWAFLLVALLCLPLLEVALPSLRVATLTVNEPIRERVASESFILIPGDDPWRGVAPVAPGLLGDPGSSPALGAPVSSAAPGASDPGAAVPPQPAPGQEGASRTSPGEPPASATVPSATRWPGWSLNVLGALVAVWLLGALALLVRLLGQQLGLACRARGGRGEIPSEARRTVERLTAELGIARKVRLVASRALSIPATWGVWRPVVSLPATAAGWSPERTRAVLLHELAHVRRWDYLTLLASQIACALYWPNPLIWKAARRTREEQELACDETVLLHGTPSSEYADHLVSVAREALAPAPRLHAALAMAGAASLRKRLGAVVGFRGVSRRARWLAAVAGLALIGSVLPTSALRVQSARQLRVADGLVELEAGSLDHRLEAASVLGALRAEEAVGLLVGTLESGSPALRAAAVNALSEIGSRRAAPFLIRRLSDSDVGVREAAIVAIGRFRDRRGFYQLDPLTKSSDLQIRVAATWALGEIKCVPAITTLSRLARFDAEESVRSTAARGLRGAPARLAEPALRAALRDRSPDVRLAAVESLALLYEGPATAALREALADPHPGVRDAAARALRGHAPADVPAARQL